MGDMIMRTFHQLLATFLIWFITVFAVGLGILVVMKLFQIMFL